MVLKITDPVERERWEAHLRMTNSFKSNTKQYRADQQKVIEMTAEGKSLREIKEEVPGRVEKVLAARNRGRRGGLC